MSTVNHQGIRYLPPKQGETLWVMGDQVTFKTDADHDGMTIFESVITPGGGPPPHVHKQQEEAHYVLEGTFSFLNGTEWIKAPAGSFILIPRGVRHAFRNVGATNGRLLSSNNLPGKHEAWFRHVGVPITDPATFRPPKGMPDMVDVVSSAAREDIYLEAPDHA